MSESEWPSSRGAYPPYCTGPLYMFRSSAAGRLLSAFDALPSDGSFEIFWLEDVFVTGELFSMVVLMQGEIAASAL